jgi:transcriptional regulator with XRE-family HTH domain
MKKRMVFMDQIRAAVRRSGLTGKRICKMTGMDKATLSRFINGLRCMTEGNLNRLADVLSLRVVEREKRRKGARRGRH